MYGIIVLFLMCSFSSINGATTTAKYHSDDSEKYAPFFVILRSRYSKGSHRICGGVIITNSLILTAAECVYEEHRDEIEVRDASGNSRIKIAKIVAHSGFRGESCNNIAALHTTFDIDFSESVHAINLPPRNYQILEKEAHTSPNWGQRPFTSYGTIFAKETTFFVAYPRSAKCANKNCLNTTFCTANTDDICSDGNMGSPLVHNSILVGILSNLVSTCTEGKPVAYTSISAHIDFIEGSMLLSNNLTNFRRRGNIVEQQTKDGLKDEEEGFTSMMKIFIFLGFLMAMFFVAGAFILLFERTDSSGQRM